MGTERSREAKTHARTETTDSPANESVRKPQHESVPYTRSI